MKQFILSALVLIASYRSIAQDKPKCGAPTKAGISVMYIVNKDTFALDYLTAKEYDSLRAIHRVIKHTGCKLPVKVAGAKCHIHTKAHACKWKLCPYKGICATHSSRAVSEYTGETGTDAYRIDMLHIQYPADSYEELEAKLLTVKN